MSLSVQDYVAMQPRFAWRRRVMRAFARFVFRLALRLEFRGVENVPANGGAVLMMNHISLLDPILCIAAVTHRFVVPMSKIENLHNPVVGPLVRAWGAFTVNRDEVDRKALMNSIELLKSGELILIAPEGTRQEHGLARPKEGFAYVVTKADAVIVPAAISGAKDWQKKLLRLQRPHIVVSFGKPFKFRTDGRVPRDLLPVLMDEAMYQLSEAVVDETMRGVYGDLSQASVEHLEFVQA
ncbi:MAG: 1-acyl-sn-glycerol-3-phosphate acyltransferase [Anaerolineae bacterium]|nr:1-acyl-sn-glycerol-3-phosphate acyltransferase [Anaerolineae bacterium]NUQ02625.1 1-acyl-sn-glycerol-3-phosphate acyltransferase [Anaerolineae bacterium]